MWRTTLATLGAIALAGSAAGSTVSLIWTGAAGGAILGLGTSVVDVSLAFGAVTLTLDVILNADAAGISSGTLDLRFDQDGFDELDLLSWSEFSWANSKATASLVQATPGIEQVQESQYSGAEGQAFGFEGFTLGQGPANVTLTFARVVFFTSVIKANADGLDVFATGRDIRDNAGLPVTLVTEAAAVNGDQVPEPSTLALLGLGLLGIAAASGRRVSEN